MPSATIIVELPRNRLLKEGCSDDDFLINQLSGINDHPEEDGLPLRRWLIREAHVALLSNLKLTEVTLKPKAEKTSRTHFLIRIEDSDA
ncbi:unnamed protein product [Phytomonas sp. Hart1]|nr:unnamed protein product [Phytomonas sp. Hart1]|eukprot:CCW70764.1 unnamed protein product [Phytomonas sp. isolate Hart1]